MPNGAKRWCFTLNNPSTEENQLLSRYYQDNHVEYLVYGRETGESGTTHWQGYTIFHERKTLAHVRRTLPRAHWEISRGTPKQASDYCKKEGNYEEHGTLPSTQGKRNDWE